ncbi:MAG: hypothetical protein JSW11_18075 [Candidatus Heimdallarchaeota archaeon]|nr:MAG: hypothetical protein JSW11_18075 [Candidatus Heimdallarchaeota archaeon]
MEEGEYNFTIFIQNEGLTLTTLHDVGHLFGLNHPHDYWNPFLEKVEYSWIWGYAGTPMTYLSTGYDWDFFDKQATARVQIHSINGYMNGYNYMNEQIHEFISDIEIGTDTLREILPKAQRIHKDYHIRVKFIEVVNNILLLVGTIILGIIISAGVIIYRKEKTQ